MASYLLGINTLIDICFKNTNSHIWIGKQHASTLIISVVSIAAVKAYLNQYYANNQVILNDILVLLDQVLKALHGKGAKIVSFDRKAADEWANWLNDSSLHISRGSQLLPINLVTKMMIATAKSRGYTLVEPSENYHGLLVKMNVKVISL